jgi:HPt (histidine-containing phosphotransfer) domain-containing protein
MRTYIIHTIKSALANIGKLELSAIALKLEQAARNKISEIILADTEPFFETLRTFLKDLKRTGIVPETKTSSMVFDMRISGLDIANGLEQVGNDESAYMQIVRSYVESIRPLLLSIETVDESKLKDYKIVVHSIKGTSYYIFADKVGRQAEALEKASVAGDFNYVTENNPGFLVLAWKLIRDLDDMLAIYDAETVKPLKSAPSKEMLLKLRDACKRFDMDGLDEAMEEIGKYRYDSDDGLADWLRETVNKMDMAGIVERLSYLED